MWKVISNRFLLLSYHSYLVYYLSKPLFYCKLFKSCQGSVPFIYIFWNHKNTVYSWVVGLIGLIFFRDLCVFSECYLMIILSILYVVRNVLATEQSTVIVCLRCVWWMNHTPCCKPVRIFIRHTHAHNTFVLWFKCVHQQQQGWWEHQKQQHVIQRYRV